MNSEITTITQYLWIKYPLKAIPLHGSRLRREAMPNKDYDSSLVTGNRAAIVPDTYVRLTLNSGGMDYKTPVAATGATLLKD